MVVENWLRFFANLVKFLQFNQLSKIGRFRFDPCLETMRCQNIGIRFIHVYFYVFKNTFSRASTKETTEYRIVPLEG